jgi:hypothetical protein
VAAVDTGGRRRVKLVRCVASAKETHAPLVILLCALTSTTGLVDAVSVLGLGRVFTANMTGNVSFSDLRSAVLLVFRLRDVWPHWSDSLPGRQLEDI